MVELLPLDELSPLVELRTTFGAVAKLQWLNHTPNLVLPLVQWIPLVELLPALELLPLV